MRKEFQAVEWLLIFMGLGFLIYGSKYLFYFSIVFIGYYFMMTLGVGIWMLTRYFKRYKKKNIVIFHLKQNDQLTTTLILKSVQLLSIVLLLIYYYKEHMVYIPVGLAFLFFMIQMLLNGKNKLVFHDSKLHKDAIFFEDLLPIGFEMYNDGVIIKGEKDIQVKFDEIDTSKFDREVEFEENQVLDDLFLGENENELTRTFINEIVDYAEKLELPIHQKKVNLAND